MLTAVGFITVIALIFLVAFVVAAEFAFVAVRRVQLEEGAKSGDKKSIRALAIHKRLSFMLTGAQLAITAIALVIGFLAEPAVGPVLEPLVRAVGVNENSVEEWSFTLAFVLVTAASMVFSELVPKNLAIAKTLAVTRSLSRSTAIYLRLFGPVIYLFDAAANGLLRLMRIQPVEELHGGISPEELDVIVQTSRKEGSLSESQARLLARALEFPDLRAADAMVPRSRVIAIDERADCGALLQLLSEGHARFPVVPVGGDVNDTIGIAYAKDLLGLAVDERTIAPVRNVMREPVAVPEQAKLTTVLSTLRSSRSELALVVDEYGGTAGIITLEDVVEELVGSISDEYDVSEPAPRQKEDGSWSVPGWWRIDELAQDCDVHLEENDEYDTVAGLMISLLGHIPTLDEVVAVHERHRHDEDAPKPRLVNLKATEIDGLSITRVQISVGDAIAEEVEE